MTGIELIKEERQHQIDIGYTVEKDVKFNTEYQLSEAAAALTLYVPDEMLRIYLKGQAAYPPVGWNNEIWNKMILKPYKEKLVIAGALIAAELDRLT